MAAGVVLISGSLFFGAPALAEDFPAPSASPSNPSPTLDSQPPRPSVKPDYTIRASAGVAFASNGYYCGYYNTYYTLGYSCGAGYVTAWPDVNLDLDIWPSPSFGLTLGANVMWGTYTPHVSAVPANQIYSTTWEPHVDFLASLPGSALVQGRARLGFGLYIAEANGTNFTGQNVAEHGLGGAFRVGLGASFLPKSKVGLGVDAIFEAGWIGSSYVSTVQLLIGPELHF